MNNKNFRYNIIISGVMIATAILIYVLQIVIFKDPHESMFLLFQDLAFLPISVILISYILEKYLKNMEKEENFKKLQIVVSAFYSEVGSTLIRKISQFDSNLESFKEKMDFEQELRGKDKKKIIKLLRNFDYDIDSHTGNLEELKEFLTSKKMFISRMFENPNLMEHSRFTDMLWSVYHLLDELENREDFSSLPKNDMLHLSIDIMRAYPLLIIEWFEYMTYLRQEYPYLYSLAIRKSPFEENHIIID